MNHSKLISRTLIAVLLTSLIWLASPFVLAQQLSAQWNGPMGNYPFNWNYSPQKQIGPGNVKDLQVGWVFPIPSAPKVYSGDESIIITPLVVDGIVYSITNYHFLIAQDLKDGKILWQKELPLLQFKFPLPGGLTNITGHYHAIWYTSKLRGVPLVWVSANNYTVFAFNALTGDLNLQFTTFNPSRPVPGSFGFYDTITPTILIDEVRGILIAGSSGSEGTDAGRGFFMGYDVTQTPPKLLWTTFIIPPQDGSDPNWSIKSVQNMSYAYIFDGKQAIDLKALSPSQLNSMLYGDWGNFGFNGTHSFAGAGTGWGGTWALDPATGIAYVGTAQPAPDDNATTRPGPNLWSDSILAIDVRTGKIVWGFQTTAHDLWDWDCSWGVMLANATINGKLTKVVYKGCKNGYFYALDAATGKMYWYFDPPSLKRNQYTRLLNPLDANQMRKPWANYPSTSSFVSNPWASGGIESNPAYDPVTNTVFVVSYNNPTVTQVTPVIGKGVPYGAAGVDFNKVSLAGEQNSTLWAIDASTGKPKWNHFVAKIPFRGGIAVSNGVVYVPRNDGFIDMIDASTGALLNSKFIGGALITQPAIAADSNGQVKLVMPASGGIGSLGFGFLGFPTQPGYLFALGLAAPATVTQTQVQTQTQVSTATLVQTVQAPVGIDPGVFYAVTGLLAVFIIATGVLAIRRRTSAT